MPTTRDGGDAFAAEFDQRLDGHVARLIDASPAAEEVVADAVRAVFGLRRDAMSTDEAIERVLNPALNSYRLEIAQPVSYHSPLMRSLLHAHYTFAKRISHTADSQDQRHRMVLVSRPLLTLADTSVPDYVMPRLIVRNAGPGGVRESDDPGLGREGGRLGHGVPTEFAILVLPNAKAVRFIESGHSSRLFTSGR